MEDAPSALPGCQNRLDAVACLAPGLDTTPSVAMGRAMPLGRPAHCHCCTGGMGSIAGEVGVGATVAVGWNVIGWSRTRPDSVVGLAHPRPATAFVPGSD